MQDTTLLLLALTYKCGSAGSAHCIKIGDGRLCMQWPHAIVGPKVPYAFSLVTMSWWGRQSNALI